MKFASARLYDLNLYNMDDIVSNPKPSGQEMVRSQYSSDVDCRDHIGHPCTSFITPLTFLCETKSFGTFSDGDEKLLLESIFSEIFGEI